MINLALIGAGRWGKSYLDSCKSLPGIKISDICTRETDIRLLLKKKDISGFIIASPTSTHYKIAKKLIRLELGKSNIISVNGCIYGRDNNPHKVNKNPDLSYHKICGQSFWELISGDDQLYKKIIQPLDKEAKKRDEVFKELYIKKINEMTKDVVDIFYTKDNLDWNKIIDYVSKR